MRRQKAQPRRVSEIVEDPSTESSESPLREDSEKQDPLVSHEEEEEEDVVDCVLNITAPEDDPEGRLEKLLEILNRQENILKKKCEDKIRIDNEAADEIETKLMKKISQLPEDFLNNPATESALVGLQIPGGQNYPSCSMKKTVISRRVIRVLCRDTDAAQALSDWCKKFSEVCFDITTVPEGP